MAFVSGGGWNAWSYIWRTICTPLSAVADGVIIVGMLGIPLWCKGDYHDRGGLTGMMWEWY